MLKARLNTKRERQREREENVLSEAAVVRRRRRRRRMASASWVQLSGVGKGAAVRKEAATLSRAGPGGRLELGLKKNRNRLSAQAAFRDTASFSGSAPHPFQPKPPRPDSAEAPLIDFEFVGPDNRAGETDPIPEPQYCTAVSGQKLLRDLMLENQVELYGPYGKMMNCEGRGMCGTCLVEILEGAELMNKRTPAEPYYLKLRPDSWRLACQATVGDGTNGGKIKVKRRPQKGNPLM
ncbi:hypothetical protein L7F22_067033 [Adiantum nelumboides]|nr:hypothetical protein [Adiantum nelumboides]